MGNRRSRTDGRDARDVATVADLPWDLAARKRSEEDLRESERWLRTSQEIARLGHVVYDVRRDRWKSSAPLDRILGIDASHPRTLEGWSRLVHPDDRPAVRQHLAEAMRSGSRFDAEYRIVHPATGALHWLQAVFEVRRGADGAPVQLVGTVQDVTERKQAEAERTALQARLELAARLAAMGTLVAGVAHEINNPLAVELAAQESAMDAARRARSRLEQGGSVDPADESRALDAMIEALEDAHEAGQRIAGIVKELTAFGQPDPERKRIRPVDVVEQATRWLAASAHRKAEIRVQAGPAPAVVGSIGQLEQVVVQLVSNAVQATRPGTRGEVAIRVGTSPAGMARIEVEDHGNGIPARLLQRIFDPLSSTRPDGDGRGTGLGLTISHAIVESHGGTLTVESEVGEGTTVRIDLPAADDAAAA